MESRKPELELGRRLADRLLPFTLVIGFVISVGLPATYYLLEARALQRTATIYAQELAGELQGLILETNVLWKYQAEKYLRVINQFTPHKDIAGIRVLDEAARPITDYEFATPKGRAWWNRSAWVGSAPLVFNNRRVGTVEVGLARSPVFAVTAALLVFSAAVGAGIAGLAYTYPITVVRRLEARIQRLAEAGRLLAGTLDLQQVLDRLAHIAHSLIKTDLVTIWLVGEDGRTLSLCSQAGFTRTRIQDTLRLVRTRGLAGWVLAEARPLAVADVQSDPRVDNRAWAEAEGIRSFLGVPLLVEDRAVGIMACMTRRRRQWSPEEVAQGQALAIAAAVAIRNARLHGETEQRLRHNETLLAVAQAVTSTLDSTEAMRRVARETGRALGADMVGAYLADAAEAHLRPIAGYHVPREHLGWFLNFPIRLRGHAFIEEAWERQQPVWSADVATDPRIDPDITRHLPLGSILFFPMAVRGRSIGGLFAIWWGPRGEVSAAHRRLVEGIASQAALAIDNARLFAETQRNLRETQALLAVAESVRATHDVGEIMRRVSREAARALGADSAVFYTIDEASGRALPGAGYHIPKAILETARPLALGEVPAVLIEAFRTRQIIFVPDVPGDPRFQTPAFAGIPVKSLLASPVHAGGRAFGTLLLYWWKPVGEITEGELKLMAALSGGAGLALDNARLLAATESQAAALREKNAELDSFVYTVSHDLKAPLVTIQGMAGVLLEEHGDGVDPEVGHYLRRIQANTQQMEQLIMDLLALSRIGREARAPEEVSLTELVDGVLAELGEPLRARGFKVVVGDLGTVQAVRVQIEQVFRNLLTNAIKYIGATPSPTIEIGMARRPEAVECWVRDNGIGIDPAYHERIFEIFQRLKEVEAEGTGVGLPIVKKIVEGAGGRIWVESARGQGATFRFTWPAPPRA